MSRKKQPLFVALVWQETQQCLGKKIALCGAIPTRNAAMSWLKITTFCANIVTGNAVMSWKKQLLFMPIFQHKMQRRLGGKNLFFCHSLDRKCNDVPRKNNHVSCQYCGRKRSDVSVRNSPAFHATTLTGNAVMSWKKQSLFIPISQHKTKRCLGEKTITFCGTIPTGNAVMSLKKQLLFAPILWQETQ